MITRCSLPAAMVAALTAGLLIASVSPARANLVADPGFESCSTLGSSPPPDWSGTATCSNIAHSGSFGALFLSLGGSQTLSQSIATTAGDRYDFSFWLLNNNPPDNPNSFTASFGSGTVLDLTNASPFGYTFEDFTVTAAAASTTISFIGSPQPSGLWALDDVSVTAVPAPPLSPLGAALVGLFLLARRAYRRGQA
jgi:MYXO-CTERM domain-containing protein